MRLANLQAGSVDLVEYIVPSDVPAVQRDPRLQVVMGDAMGYQGITINIAHGPAADSGDGDQPFRPIVITCTGDRDHTVHRA